MTSEDIRKYAQQERQNADVIDHEITSKRAEMEGLRRDIDSIQRVVDGLEQKRNGHMKEAEKLDRDYEEKRRQEEQDELHRQQLERDSLSHKVAEGAKRSLFF